MMEKMEDRRLLAAVPVEIPTVNYPTFNGPQNIGVAQAFNYSESEGIGQRGGNDGIFNADFVPLGTGVGQQDKIDITGDVGITIATPPYTLPDGTIIPATFNTDIDTYAFDLRAGDILDIATLAPRASSRSCCRTGSFGLVSMTRKQRWQTVTRANPRYKRLAMLSTLRLSPKMVATI